MKDGDLLIGALAFGVCRAVLNLWDTSAIPKKRDSKDFLDALLEDYCPDQDISITTYRKGDRADTGYREELRQLGFAERELLIEFGYPTQRFVFHAKHSETNNDK